MYFTCNNDSPDALTPSMVDEKMSKMERDGLLVYSENISDVALARASA
jgi:hypothetical protein